MKKFALLFAIMVLFTAGTANAFIGGYFQGAEGNDYSVADGWVGPLYAHEIEIHIGESIRVTFAGGESVDIIYSDDAADYYFQLFPSMKNGNRPIWALIEGGRVTALRVQ